jgi:membrane-bound metal-dependent hydrolase YbcI (DUF457 family)
MANFKTHCIVGVAVGAGLNLVKQSSQRAIDPGREFDWGELLFWCTVGGTAASLPDLLEPASNPNHRGFFHSFAFAALILCAILGEPSSKLREKFGHLPLLTGFSYLSHLALDIITPMGLPIA